MAEPFLALSTLKSSLQATTANNNCADDTNAGSGDRIASLQTCAARVWDQIVLYSFVTSSVPKRGTSRGGRRTGPATHMPKSLASTSWPSRPYRARGQPSCGKRLHRQQDAVGGAGSRAETGGGAYKSSGMCIARSDGGTRPSNRFPSNPLQPNGFRLLDAD
jgi:hypothetical protein